MDGISLPGREEERHEDTLPSASVRTFPLGNLVGLRTLYWREVHRFVKVGMQTIFAPVITSLLFLFIFTLAFPGRPPVNGVAFSVFLTPGIVMMAILNNAFQNTSSSLSIAKMQKTISDFLQAPLSPLELALGFLGGAATRGILVGAVTLICIILLGPGDARVHDPLALIYYGLVASLFMAATGLVAGLWAQKFDQLAVITNFVILPLTMLSGTFYPITALNEPLRTLSAFNPFFHLIDGFRYAMTGNAEGNILLGGTMTLALTVGLCLLCWALFRSGYRLKD